MNFVAAVPTSYDWTFGSARELMRTITPDARCRALSYALTRVIRVCFEAQREQSRLGSYTDRLWQAQSEKCHKPDAASAVAHHGASRRSLGVRPGDACLGGTIITPSARIVRTEATVFILHNSPPIHEGPELERLLLSRDREAQGVHVPCDDVQP